MPCRFLALNFPKAAAYFCTMKSWITLSLLFTVASVCAQDRLYPFRTKTAYGYFNTSFQPVDGPSYTVAQAFFDGRAVASTKSSVGLFDPLVGLINTQGQWVLPQEFDKILPFSQGLAVAKRKGKWGILDGDRKNRLPFPIRRARTTFR